VNSTEQLPEFPNSRNLQLSNKPLLDSLFREMQPPISELTFTNLFVWNRSEPVGLSRFDEAVLLQRKRLRDGRTFMMPPLGRQILAVLIEKLKGLNARDCEVPPVYGVTPEQLRLLDKKGVSVEMDRDDWDYVYLTSDLTDLPGDRFHPKRNFIARCLSKHKCEYRSIGASEIDDCLRLQTEWCNLRYCGMVPSLEAENVAIKTVLDNYEPLRVSGGCVYVDGKLEAFTLAEALNDDTAVVHFEKANPRIEGLYQLINQWFCQKAIRDFKFVNREQDLGVPGLRKAKQSYHPTAWLKSTSYTYECRGGIMSLNSRVAVITGATGALGRVVVKMILGQGAHVVSVYRSEEMQRELAEYVGEATETLTSVQADVTNESNVQALFQRVITKYGRVDILLNIVGAYRGGTEIANTKESDWDFLMNVNLKSAFFCSKAALPHMMAQNYGKIVNVASRTGGERHFRSKSGAYVVSKAGVIVLTETIAEEVGKYDINVNCVVPSTIDTLDNRRDFPGADFSKWVKPEQIARVILFLVSDDSKAISGASIPVYGKA
jgi:NAD(P)-dependent dehydrogenase (short-subunit alcohol dehydrogenase family)